MRIMLNSHHQLIQSLCIFFNIQQKLQRINSALSSLSNYHWVNNITLSTNTQQKKTFTGFINHMLYHPDKNEQNTNHIPVPTSPQIRLMYMLTNEIYENTLGPHIKNYLHQDFPPEQPLHEHLELHDYAQRGKCTMCSKYYW